ncbi:alpha/beta hydrolase fold domain-containing protein [Sandaracinobacter sp. RS1-74]|uniref:alpha/beta hydrolase n=1 Tax=Sandaracinobacteroides sayramensis TaxID=2913411 RepID=UPI001EDC27D9|nr:alpha/beta hydrolase [Sandaracinobacteroides sayramensis]MCG2840709.1 alpha/beta hydrolase fold domain-containing protein [Sandaracinobacteroides sayramensis]
MELDPMVAQLLEAMKAGPQVYRLPVAEARAGMESRVELLRPLAPQAIRCEDISIPSADGPLPARLYRAEGVDGPLPTLVYLHGGGWVLGSVETHDNVCRFLADRGPLLVLSVDYRLAPEHKAPAQQADAMAALQWAAANAATHGGDPKRLLVGGDSAGGNLAALAALEARGCGLRLAGQLLVYPVTDFPADAYESYAENADYGLDRPAMEWFWAHWLPEDVGPDPCSAPMRAENMAGLPPAYVITASHDVLRDEGKAYASRLAEAGALAAHDHVPGTIHGFFSMAGLVPLATETLDRAAHWAASVKPVP